MRAIHLVRSEECEGAGATTAEAYREFVPDRPLDADEAHIRMLGISAPARGSGAGSGLMVRAIERARQVGKSELTLNSTSPMTAAQSLSGSLGFTRLDDEVPPDGGPEPRPA